MFQQFLKKKTNKTNENSDPPELYQLKSELKREQYKNKYKQVFKSTSYTLIVVAAIAVLTATLWLPVLRIYGSSMTPTLTEDDIVVSIKTNDFERGDLVAFYIGNKVLVKRYIAGAGEWVKIDEDGNVYVNDKLLEEPYLTEKALGDCNIEFPYQVPDGKIFVMGDHRSVSLDSRNTNVGCIASEQIVGEIVFRVWPTKELGSLE